MALAGRGACAASFAHALAVPSALRFNAGQLRTLQFPAMLPLTDSGITALSHIIQASVAPVFLLTGIGSILGVLANRLGRIVDRARYLEARPELQSRSSDFGDQVELLRLNERKRWINRAITLCTLCALLVCTVIATLFVGAFVSLRIGTIVAVLFILSMLALIAGLVCFLREIYVAVNKERTPRNA